MATYKQVSYGSQGSGVTELQKLLNKNGYSLDEDGIFGSKTQAAVKDYQKKSGLSVDGIVGNNTWGALTKVTAPAPTASPSSSAGSATPTAQQWSYDPFKVSGTTASADQKRQELASQKPGDFTYGAYEKSDAVKQAEAMLQQQLSQKPGDFTYGEYQKSDAVQQAEAMLQQQLANKPGAYQSAWQTQLNDIINRIQNREAFSYDLNGDALYQQYKDQYMTQGQQAMMDTMGQAAALTGGYGSSYGQSVGQQAYQGYLQQLNEVVPELYQLALNQYNQEGNQMYDQAALMAQMENQDYGRYRDTVSDYNTELGRLTEDARYQSESDYNRFMDAYNMAYGQHRDKVSDYYTELDRLTSDSRYQSETDYGRFMDALNLAYGQHRDNVSDYYTELGRADEDYWNQYNRDYSQYADNRNISYQQNRDQVADGQWDQSFQYQQDRDAVADKQWQAQFDEAKRQYDQQYALSAGKTSGSTDSSGNPGKTGNTGASGYDNGGYGTDVVKQAQAFIGASQDGKWGRESTAKAKAAGYDSIADVVAAMGGGPVVNGFTGKTYSEAAAYLKANGHSASGLMTNSVWTSHKNKNNSAGGEHEASSYQEYLAAFIYDLMN